MTTYSVTVDFPTAEYREDYIVPNVVEIRREFGALVLTDVDRVEQCFARSAWAGYVATPEPLDAREVRRVQQLGGPLPACPSPATMAALARFGGAL